MLAGVAILSLAGCSTEDWSDSIGQTINDSITLPETYSITYEVESAIGEIHTVAKLRDADGNIYFRSGNEEMLFVADGSNYVLYERTSDGSFVASDSDAVYNETYVDSVTEEFLQYVEKSKDQFIPGMEESSSQEMLGRTCLAYSVKVGTDSTAVTYTLLVDEETGICLSWEENKQIAWHDLPADSDTFHCVEFIITDVPNLLDQI